MNFRTSSRLSRIDFHLNGMTEELFEFIHDKTNDLTDEEKSVLMQSYNNFCDGLDNITNNIKY